jgi:hypothetical protein
MTSKQYPQFILFGDSIIQFSSLLRDGFCFGAGLEEREFRPYYCGSTLEGTLSSLCQFIFCTKNFC